MVLGFSTFLFFGFLVSQFFSSPDLSLGGNWVDLVILAVLAAYLLQGLMAGFLVLLADLVSFLSSLFIAFRFYPAAADFLLTRFAIPQSFAKAAGFIMVAVLAEAILGLLLRFFASKLPKGLVGHTANRVLGIFPALANGAIIVTFFLVAALALPTPGFIKQDIGQSRIGGYLLSYAGGAERAVREVFGEAVNQTLTFLTVEPGSGERANLYFTAKEYFVSPENERRLFEATNQERVSRGLSPLSFDEALAKVGRDHAADMFNRGYFGHISPEGEGPSDRLEAAGIVYTLAGENLALAPSSQIAHQGLMQSQGHRANILEPEFGRVGIGALDGGIYGIMFVEVFTD